MGANFHLNFFSIGEGFDARDVAIFSFAAVNRSYPYCYLDIFFFHMHFLLISTIEILSVKQQSK